MLAIELNIEREKNNSPIGALPLGGGGGVSLVGLLIYSKAHSSIYLSI